MSSRTPKERQEHKRVIKEMLADLRRWAVAEAGDEPPDVHMVVNPNQVYGGGWLIRAFIGEQYTGAPRRLWLESIPLHEAIIEWRRRKKEQEEEHRRNQELAERN
jgi:hypothetical protein